MIILLVLAALVVGAPLVAALLVSVASRREDTARSLIGQAPGWLTAAVRRLLRADSARPPGGVRPPLPRPRSGDHDADARPLTRR